jgi:hypothetical protein
MEESDRGVMSFSELVKLTKVEVALVRKYFELIFHRKPRKVA